MNYADTCHQMGYAVFSHANKEKAQRLIDGINFMVEHATDARLDCVQRAVKILEDGYKKKEPDPYTEKLWNVTKKIMEKEFKKDMIYYSLCYDGFRV